MLLFDGLGAMSGAGGWGEGALTGGEGKTPVIGGCVLDTGEGATTATLGVGGEAVGVAASSSAPALCSAWMWVGISWARGIGTVRGD